MKDICKGCHVKEFCNVPNLYGVYVAEECPCNICLIKGVCNHGCEDYDEFERRIVEIRRQKYEIPDTM